MPIFTTNPSSLRRPIRRPDRPRRRDRRRAAAALVLGGWAAFAAHAGPILDDFDPRADDNVYAFAAQPEGKLLLCGQTRARRALQGRRQPRCRLRRQPRFERDSVTPPLGPNLLSTLASHSVTGTWHVEIRRSSGSGVVMPAFARLSIDGMSCTP